MTEVIQQLLAKIQETEQKIHKVEGQALELIIEQSRHLAKLRKKTRKNWLRDLKSINFSPRVASRYLTIAKHWGPNKTPESDLLASLPFDLLKLEWLCRLKQADLKKLCDETDLRQTDRGTVINEVKLLLGEKVEIKKITVKAVKKSWENCRETVLTNLVELDPQERNEFIEELMNGWEDFINDLREVDEDESISDESTEGDDDEVGDDGDDDANDDVQEKVVAPPAAKEVPVQNAPASRESKPVGRQRGKQSV